MKISGNYDKSTFRKQMMDKLILEKKREMGTGRGVEGVVVLELSSGSVTAR